MTLSNTLRSWQNCKNADLQQLSLLARWVMPTSRNDTICEAWPPPESSVRPLRQMVDGYSRRLPASSSLNIDTGTSAIRLPKPWPNEDPHPTPRQQSSASEGGRNTCRLVAYGRHPEMSAAQRQWMQSNNMTSLGPGSDDHALVFGRRNSTDSCQTTSGP